jgi:hypothetical protein
MKKRKMLFVFAGALLAASLGFVACEYEDDVDRHDIAEKECHDEGTLFCDYEGDYGCCESDTPWTDGHGSCYNTLSYCRSTGWSCVSCY